MPVEFESYEADGEPALRLTRGADANAILRFLAANPSKGFTPAEIASAVDVTGPRVGLLLARLAERDLVRQKGPYWAVAADGRLESFEAKLHRLTANADRTVVEDWADWAADSADPPDEAG
ncbi:MAG: MarR family transcriptional regulator [Halobacteriales archaeon]